MIVKFRDSTIQSLKRQASASADNAEPVDAEKEGLRNEVAELQKLIEHHPEVTRFAYENITLQDRLSRVEAYLSAQQSYEREKATRLAYERELSKQILALTHQLEASRGSTATESSDALSETTRQALAQSKEDKEKWALERTALKSEIDRMRNENVLLGDAKEDLSVSLDELRVSQ